MRYLIFGGTGTLGSALTKKLLEDEKNEVVVVSRDEDKQIKLQRKLNYNDRLSFIMHDIRNDFNYDFPVDLVINCAALKHVQTGFCFPNEIIQTNIIGAKNIIEWSIRGSRPLIFISTDKAVNPLNFYGQSKALIEQFCLDWIAKGADIKIIRLGNIFGSRGSVVPLFIETAKKTNRFKISDLNCDRYFISIDNAVNFILNSIKDNKNICIPEMKKANICDVAKAVRDDAEFEIIGLRNGEKITEETGIEQKNEYFTIDELKEMIKGLYE